MNIFLSHISEEALLALVLKEWIQMAFGRKFRVFVSSDIQNIAAGDKWLTNLEVALSKARILIVLCSPNSVTRPWVNFEVGSAWVKQMPIIPVCHSGQRLDSLPVPLSSFQGLDIHSAIFSDVLIGSLIIRGRLRKRPKFGEKRKRMMQKEIRAALRRIKVTTATRTGKPFPDKITMILKKIATSNNKDCTWRKLAKALKMDANDLDVYLRHMMDRKLITKISEKRTKNMYVTTKIGREYLVQH